MATIDWPTTPPFKPSRMTWGASTPKAAWSGAYTGQTQSLSHLGDRLRVELTLPPCSYADAGPREAFLMSLASTGDWVRLSHFMRPAPAGSLRGVPTLSSDVAAGARSISIVKAGTDINLVSEAQSFAAASWLLVNTPVVTANVSTRPNSSAVTADQITDDSVTQTEGVEQVIAVPNDGTTYTASIYVKATSGGTSKTFALEVLITGGSTVSEVLRINTDTGAVLSGTGTVTSTDSGTWWRISRQVSNNASGNTSLQFRVFPARCDHNSAVVDVTQTGSAIVWGAQLEAGVTVSNLSQPTVRGGDVLGLGGQLVIVAYQGASQTTNATMSIPLALPLRQAATAGAAVTWDRPTGTFQLLGDLSQVQYLPGRYQDAITLQFVEAF